MIEQRLQQRLRLLLALPAAVILLVSALAVTTARTPGIQPREDVFDLFARLSPRPELQEPSVAIIDIDEESTKRLGPWPWPRTALAELVTAAEEAGASAAVVTIPTEGPDPLSPEVVGRYWMAEARGQDQAAQALRRLPSNDVALAASASGLPTALGVARDVPPSDRTPLWQRTDLATTDWLRVAGEDETGFLALPAATSRGAVSPILSAAAVPAVIGLPTDGDGTVRRTPLMWSLDGLPAPTAGLAPLVPETIIAAPAHGRLRVGGTPVRALAAGDVVLPVDSRGELRLWLPADLDVPSVPAWRVLTGGEQWTQSLRDRAVFIGYSGDEDDYVRTARGPLSLAQAQALLLEQLSTEAVLRRPGWAGPTEALLAILAGTLAVGAAIFGAPVLATLITMALTAAAFGVAYFAFQGAGLLIDPLPVLFAAAGGQLAVLAVVVGNMLLRDDAVRGAFHGALPPATMNKLQSRGGQSLLRGTRREVTVLSCSLRLPPGVTRRFEDRPDDFVRFAASANDALRRTILAHQGTVDYGENGQLLGYWNVPEATENHVEHACACALRMIDDVAALSENVTTAALAGSGAFDEGFAEGAIEIGIASGPCFAGPVGVGTRNRYAVIGEAVSLATKLRARSKLYGPAIVTDDVVFDALRHHYAFLDLDVVRLDPSSPVRGVYGLVGNPFLKASKSFRQLADTQRELLGAWRSGDVATVAVQLQRLRALPGVPDAYVALFEERITLARVAGEEWEPAETLEL